MRTVVVEFRVPTRTAVANDSVRSHLLEPAQEGICHKNRLSLASMVTAKGQLLRTRVVYLSSRTGLEVSNNWRRLLSATESAREFTKARAWRI